MHKKMKICLLILLVGMAWVVAAPLSTRPQTSLPGGSIDRPGYYLITPRFNTDRINSRMLMSHNFRLAPNDSLAQAVAAIRRQFRPNTDPDVVAYGNAVHVPVGWAFVELVNATDQPQAIVLSMSQIRSNLATLFVGRDNRLDFVGTVRNTTPLGQRFFPSLNLAFPVDLPPRTTLPLLLRSESRVGFHEVDVRLSRQDVYSKTTFIDNIRDGAQVIVCLLLASLALLIGWRSNNRLMLTYGSYMLSLCGAFSCLFGYLYFLPFPGEETSINAATLGTLFRLGIGITIHPFLYEVIKPAIRDHRRYKRRVIGFCAVSALCIGLHLMPYRYYDQVNYVINVTMTGLDIVNISWIACYSVLAWHRAGIGSMMVACLLMFTPALLNQFLFLLQASEGQDSFRTPVTNPMLIIIVLSYLAFEQFRKQLVTRQLLRAQVLQTQEDINALRRQEIEGIGRDLHDQVGNTLATVLGYLGRIPADTEKPRNIIISAIKELRFMSHNLVKDDERPLTDKVDALISRFNDFAPIQLSFTDYTHRQVDSLSPLKQQNIYSIIQELLTNIIRHSQAGHAHVEFFCDGTTVDVSVEDDGVGFDRSPANITAGIGIQNIYKRATLSNIEVHFDPAPSGTTILLKTLLHDVNPSHSY